MNMIQPLLRLTVQAAKSLFSRKQLAEDGAYSDLKLPDLSGFWVYRFEEDKDDYTFIGKTFFSNLLNDATRLSQEDPELYAAFLIASTTGFEMRLSMPAGIG